jgi:hypothetical protein
MQQPRTIPRSGAALILPRQPAEGQNRESGTEKAEQRRQNREAPWMGNGDREIQEGSEKSDLGYPGMLLLQDLSSFMMDSGGTKRSGRCIVVIVRRNEAGKSLMTPDVNTISAQSCLHISLRNRYYR